MYQARACRASSGLYVRALDLNGVGDAGELLWYTIINATEHLWRIGDAEAAAVGLGALSAAPAAPTDDLINRATGRLRARLDEEPDLAVAELEFRGRSMRLADLLRFLRERLTEHAGSVSAPRAG